MSNEEFEPAARLLEENAPNDWCKLCAHYRYHDGLMDIKVFFKKSLQEDWSIFDTGGFDLMDFFDEYRSKTHHLAENPWSGIRVTVDKTRKIEVDFEYHKQDIFSR
ncbi:hypothetical protein [Spartinivicinus poritis]|uniref:Uncharacterized protein n=1 Tax=Spartinivicinus poritis TaxID=2994640 RepID=A0ABT5UJA0_9GAMM|nr:hypothetical protein [Spartinivicinus sp. A2-2]MDE1465493.1 hypothetical protein [Spartinivicinus sp. A2-2]